MSIERHMNALASHYNTGFVDIKTAHVVQSYAPHDVRLRSHGPWTRRGAQQLLNLPRYPSRTMHAPPTALKFWQNKTLHVDSEPPQLTSSAYYHTELHTGVTEGGDHRCRPRDASVLASSRQSSAFARKSISTSHVRSSELPRVAT